MTFRSILFCVTSFALGFLVTAGNIEGRSVAAGYAPTAASALSLTVE